MPISQHDKSGYKHGQPCKARVANNMVAGMPERALELIRGGQFQGGDLVVLKSEIHRPSWQDSIMLKGTMRPNRVRTMITNQLFHVKTRSVSETSCFLQI